MFLSRKEGLKNYCNWFFGISLKGLAGRESVSN